MMTPMQILDGIRQGKLRALSRLISMAENGDETAPAILAELFELTGRARVLGITGPPGAGKSTLTNALVRFLRESGKKVAIVAVDPVSPFTGGALLGDRIRLVDHFNDPGVFIRSLSTRGKLGGLSLATREVVHAVDAFGFDYVLIETVGVGQSEVEIRKIADLSIVVLMPEWGDGIQALKAGVLEIGDLFTVNKADREGADRVVTEIKNMLHIAGRDATPVLTTSVQDETSLRALLKEIDRLFVDETAKIVERRREGTGATATELLESRVLAEARRWAAKNVAPGTNPYRRLIEFLKDKPLGTLFRE